MELEHEANTWERPIFSSVDITGITRNWRTHID